MKASPVLLWFRRDLRLQDNPALASALKRGGPVIPVFILDEASEIGWPPGAASRWWLHRSLEAMEASLRSRGSRLVLRKGDSAAVLRELIADTGAAAVYWNRRYEPAALSRDARIERQLATLGVEVRTGNSALLFEPADIRNRQGGPFQVFTPFWRHCRSLPVAPPVRVPTGAISSPAKWPRSWDRADLGLRPAIAWDGGLAETWQPGEEGAQLRLRHFLSRAVERYDTDRNRPDRDGTSMLSPHLHFGEIGPRRVWQAVVRLGRDTGVFPAHRGADVFLAEIGWREFAYHLLFHFPRTPSEPLQSSFSRFPWAEDPGGRHLRAWQHGRTGYPIVDAGMRQLWRTGWMHNRVRMLAGSFLVKHLRLPWTAGAAWFWDTLVDADLASNTLGWQWVAGCGADAAPYFRVFNPVLQGSKFDPDGDYVRRWIPELSRLPAKSIHAPWEAPGHVLAAAGVELGRTYPHPIVDPAHAREAALTAWRSLRSKD